MTAQSFDRLRGRWKCSCRLFRVRPSADLPHETFTLTAAGMRRLERPLFVAVFHDRLHQRERSGQAAIDRHLTAYNLRDVKKRKEAT